jgi:hypothetical protein
MRLRRALYHLSGLAVLLHAGAAAQVPDPSYLRRMPSSARVEAAVQGTDRVDTAARQMGAFWQLMEVIKALAGPRNASGELTKDEERLLSEYFHAWQRYQYRENLPPIRDRPRWDRLRAAYETDPALLDELLRRLFSPEFRAAFYGTTGKRPPAGSPAVAVPPERMAAAQNEFRMRVPRRRPGPEPERRGLSELLLSLLILLLLLPVYFAPSIAGWLRTRKGAETALPLWLLFLLNLLFGGTVCVWLLLWPLALARWEFPARWSSGAGSGGGGSWDTPSSRWETPAPGQPCDVCGGRGQTCRSCQGTRGHYEYPQGATGTSQWVACSACGGSGTEQCLSCGAR